MAKIKKTKKKTVKKRRPRKKINTTRMVVDGLMAQVVNLCEECAAMDARITVLENSPYRDNRERAEKERRALEDGMPGIGVH